MQGSAKKSAESGLNLKPSDATWEGRFPACHAVDRCTGALYPGFSVVVI